MGNRFKIGRYITTFQITRGFLAALSASAFLYLSWAGWSHPLPNTILAILALYLLLSVDRRAWTLSGFFIGIFWFWWISMSFRFYGFPWAIPIGILLVALVYAALFWAAALLSVFLEERWHLPSIWAKALFLFAASYIHPFGFDWFKPELIFTESYIGVEKWQFAIVLASVALAVTKRNLLYLTVIILAYQPTDLPANDPVDSKTINIVTTYIPIDKKWDPRMLMMQIGLVEHYVDKAIAEQKKIIIFPESVLPIFLNRDRELFETLKEKSKKISIVLGALKLDGETPRNSAYLFQHEEVTIADKVILVPFGENNPLPDWLGRWVNKIFYDDAVDYQADGDITDYLVDNRQYRNAICYEACSEKLYRGSPERMIVLSNNGWFVPSVEPTMQRLLLQYYSRKYGTAIYHSINMSPSYIIQNGKIVWEDSKNQIKDRL